METLEQVNLLTAFGHDYKTRVEHAVKALQNGKGILLVDDEKQGK